LILETEKVKDFTDDTASLRRMTYKELVEDFNKDIKALEQIEKPVMVYKEEKTMMAEK
jgi:hypothetical protein